jgi:asparagine synthetase B (glutamine-hydrolysing)
VIVHDSRIVELPASQLTESGESGWSSSSDGAVLLHADPVGVDPLAWRLIDGTLHLARHPATLALLPPRPALDLETLRQIARIEYPAGSGSCFTGIFRVPAGTQVRIDPDGTAGAPRRWWQFPAEPTQSTSPDLWRALVAQCATLMSRSGDCAVLLSGGLDSSAIAAAAAAAAKEQGRSSPLLLSVVYPGLPCDESSSQEAVAHHLGLSLIQVDATLLELWPAAQDAIRERAIPTADLQAAATSRLLKSAQREGRSLVLMGLGGDALFAGDGAELELYRRGRFFSAHRFFRDWGRAGGLPTRVMWYRRGVRRHLLGDPFGSGDEVAEAGSANRAGLRRALAHPAHGWRAEMIERTIAESVTIGCPFYGKTFLDVFGRVRAIDLAAGPGFKGLLRRTVAPHLPENVVSRQRKANFHDFYRSWIGRERDTLIARYQALRPGLAPLGLPPEIAPMLSGPAFPDGLLSAWFSLGLAEFYQAWKG